MSTVTLTPPTTGRRPMNGTRLASVAGAAAVAGVAAYSSWQHMVSTALRVGERTDVALVLPLSVDGLLVTASMAMVADRQAGRTPRWSARLAFAVGVAASLAANVAHAHPTWGARAVAGWPALALLLVVELLSRAGRPVPAPLVPTVTSAPDLASSWQVTAPVEGGPSTPDPAPSTVEDNRSAAADDVDQDPVAGLAADVEDILTAAARAIAGELRAEGRRPTRDALAKRLRARGHQVSTDRATALARQLAHA